MSNLLMRLEKDAGFSIRPAASSTHLCSRDLGRSHILAVKAILPSNSWSLSAEKSCRLSERSCGGAWILEFFAACQWQ